MCGRFSLSLSPEVVEAMLEDFPLPDLRAGPMPLPRYNIAPTQPVLALGPGSGFWARWGIQRGERLQVNARSEKLARSTRRCLIVADGFYEWKRAGAHRLPYHFKPRDEGLWAFGGLHEAGAVVILTTTPNEVVAPLHDRMPVVLAKSEWMAWLDPERPQVNPNWFAPFEGAQMEVRPVSTAVNKVAHDGPECQAPRSEAGQLGFGF